MITQSSVKEFFDYQDGFLIRKKKSGPAKVGDIAGNCSCNGYSYVGVGGEVHLVHRVIFLWHFGFLPECVDHIDRNTRNNRIENLRAANKSMNAVNSKVRSSNKSGINGIYWNKRRNSWHARLKVNNVSKHIGYFKDLETAKLEYKKMALLHFGQFANV